MCGRPMYGMDIHHGKFQTFHIFRTNQSLNLMPLQVTTLQAKHRDWHVATSRVLRFGIRKLCVKPAEFYHARTYPFPSGFTIFFLSQLTRTA